MLKIKETIETSDTLGSFGAFPQVACNPKIAGRREKRREKWGLREII